MSTSLRSFTLVVVLTLASALLVAGCGSDESSSSDSGASRDVPADAPDDAGTEPDADIKTGGGGIAITPELSACMQTAGFTQDQPVAAGGLASWTHPDGARVALAPSSEAALGLAGEIGTADAPANVDGVRVATGAPALTSAAAACLDT